MGRRLHYNAGLGNVMRRFHCWRMLLLIALMGAGCTPQTTRAPSPHAAPSAPSPLVTYNPNPGGSIPGSLPDASAGQGTLDIVAGCVRLLLPRGQRVLLVWPEPTAWNVATQTITFVDPGPGHPHVELRHGDQIEPGGAPWMAHTPDIPASDSACQTDQTFIVNQVRVLPNE